VDLESGAIIAAEIHLADQGDTTTMWDTLERAADVYYEVASDPQVIENCKANRVADPRGLHIRETVQDKGYHSAQTLVDLEAVDIRGYIAEPARGRQRWAVAARRSAPPAEQAQAQQFKHQQQAAVYRNRRRLRGARSKSMHRRRGELVERSFEHVLDDGGMRRTWLKGREKVAKRYLIHVAGFNLGLIMRKLTGFGTPRGWAGALRAFLERYSWLARQAWRAFTRCLRREVCPHACSHLALAA